MEVLTVQFGQVIKFDCIAGSKVCLTIYYNVFKRTCKEISLRLFLVNISRMLVQIVV